MLPSNAPGSRSDNDVHVVYSVISIVFVRLHRYRRRKISGRYLGSRRCELFAVRVRFSFSSVSESVIRDVVWMKTRSRDIFTPVRPKRKRRGGRERETKSLELESRLLFN